MEKIIQVIMTPMVNGYHNFGMFFGLSLENIPFLFLSTITQYLGINKV